MPEYEWEIRGPKVNANVSWYFGIDGKSQFRTMDTQDQAWVLGRHAHTYTDKDAVEVTRLVGKIVVAFMHQHLRRPDLPFGGYYPLGVCQDGVAAIEKKMTGNDTLFPNTADMSLFDDPRDAEVNAMIAAIPKDHEGEPSFSGANLRLTSDRRSECDHDSRTRRRSHTREECMATGRASTHTHVAAKNAYTRVRSGRVALSCWSCVLEAKTNCTLSQGIFVARMQLTGRLPPSQLNREDSYGNQKGKQEVSKEIFK